MESLWLPEFGAFIRYHDLAGKGPAIVMLHGLGSASSADFPRLARMPALSSYRLILPDFLGFGFSDRPGGFDYSLEGHAETIYRIIESLELSNIHLFGHSMGGAVAIALAAAHSGLVSRLVVAEANLDPGIGQGSKIIAEQSESHYVREGHRRYMENIRRGIPDAPSLSIYLGTLAAVDPEAMHKSAVGLIRGTRPSQRELFLSMKIPRSYLFGERSLPDPDVEKLSSSGIDVLIVPKAGHAMMHDNPEGFAHALALSFQLQANAGSLS